MTVVVTEDDTRKYKRLDQFLSDKVPGVSRSFIKKLFQAGQIDWNDDYDNQREKLELKKIPRVGAILDVFIPPPVDMDASPENIPLTILYEDEYLIIIDKPAGLVTHPAPGHATGTLVNAILYHCKDLSGIGDTKRPGIVHRLDMGTSGVMVVAKRQESHEKLVVMFANHDIIRKYETIVIGHKVDQSGTIKSTIGRDPANRLKMAANVPNGRDAITHYKVIEYYKSLSHLELQLETGRTHQIRVHLSSLIHRPILCDPVYANKESQLNQLGKKYKELLHSYDYQLLHAKALGFIHPITGKELMFSTNPPEIFSKVLELARSE